MDTKYVIKKIFKYLLFLGLVILAIFLLSLKNNKLPTYNAQKSVGKQADFTITGIEAGAGTMSNAQKAISTYHLNKSGWQLQTSSTAIMLAQLDKAIKSHQPIVIIGWVPHWMFEKYPIKFLNDPKKVFGNSEHEDTITKKGFAKQNPGAQQFLKNFSLTLKKVQPVLNNINNGQSPKAAASQYIKDNPKQVKGWLKGVPDGHGKQISIGRENYAYETFAAYVAEKILRSKGYKVSDKGLDPGILWSALASGSIDACVTAELPVTQAAYAKKYQGQYNKVKTSLNNARVGLAVPKYMKNINSINDLKNSN